MSFFISVFKKLRSYVLISNITIMQAQNTKNTNWILGQKIIFFIAIFKKYYVILRLLNNYKSKLC
jgi:hypothetical protein